MSPNGMCLRWSGFGLRGLAVWSAACCLTWVASCRALAAEGSASAFPTGANGDAAAAESEARMFPLRIEASYGLSAADIEVPIWTRSQGNVTPDQRSTTGYFSDQRVTGSLSWRMPSEQSLRVGFGFVRLRSGAPFTSTEAVPYLWRAWGLGSEMSLVRRLGRNFDFDAGILVDILMSGVATFEERDAAPAAGYAKVPGRVAMSSGWRTGWQVGVGGWYWGPVGLTWRVGGGLTYSTFHGHAKALEIQAFSTSLGLCFELGREGP